MKVLNSRPMDEITADYDIAFAAMSKLINAAKEAGRDLSADEVTKFDSLDCEIRALAAEKAKLQKDVSAVDEINRLVASGEIPVSDHMRAAAAGGGGYGSRPGSMKSVSGKPMVVAVGPKERLNHNPPRGYLFGELCRAAAVGVSAFSPPEVRAALTSDDNSKGGYAVPDSWLTGWIDRAVEVSSIAPFCTRALMDAASSNITTITSRPTVQTKAENAKFADTTMTFGNSRLQAFTAGAIMAASMELLEDSPNAGQQIEAVTIRGLIDWMNEKLLNGSGNEEPAGVLGRGDIPTNESTGDITWDAIADAVAVLRNEIYTPNVCVVSPDVFNALHLQRELDAGDGAYLPRPEHLRDLNIIASSHCPNGKVVLGDFSQWFIGIRQGARVDVSQTAGESFERNQMLIRPKVRMDWVPTHTAAFYILADVTIPS